MRSHLHFSDAKGAIFLIIPILSDSRVDAICLVKSSHCKKNIAVKPYCKLIFKPEKIGKTNLNFLYS